LVAIIWSTFLTAIDKVTFLVGTFEHLNTYIKYKLRTYSMIAVEGA